MEEIQVKTDLNLTWTQSLNMFVGLQIMFLP